VKAPTISWQLMNLQLVVHWNEYDPRLLLTVAGQLAITAGGVGAADGVVDTGDDAAGGLAVRVLLACGPAVPGTAPQPAITKTANN